MSNSRQKVSEIWSYFISAIGVLFMLGSGLCSLFILASTATGGKTALLSLGLVGMVAGPFFVFGLFLYNASKQSLRRIAERQEAENQRSHPSDRDESH